MKLVKLVEGLDEYFNIDKLIAINTGSHHFWYNGAWIKTGGKEFNLATLRQIKDMEEFITINCFIINKQKINKVSKDKDGGPCITMDVILDHLYPFGSFEKAIGIINGEVISEKNTDTTYVSLPVSKTYIALGLTDIPEPVKESISLISLSGVVIYFRDHQAEYKMEYGGCIDGRHHWRKQHKVFLKWEIENEYEHTLTYSGIGVKFIARDAQKVDIDGFTVEYM